MGYVTISFLLAVCAFAIQYLFTPPTSELVQMLFYYNSPFVIASSLCLFLFFTKLSFQSRKINAIARAAFAVYLIHTSKYIFPVFQIKLYDFFHCHPYYLYLVFSVVFCMAIYVASFIIDQIRLIIWQKYLVIYFKDNK